MLCISAWSLKINAFLQTLFTFCKSYDTILSSREFFYHAEIKFYSLKSTSWKEQVYEKHILYHAQSRLHFFNDHWNFLSLILIDFLGSEILDA